MTRPKETKGRTEAYTQAPQDSPNNKQRKHIERVGPNNGSDFSKEPFASEPHHRSLDQ